MKPAFFTPLAHSQDALAGIHANTHLAQVLPQDACHVLRVPDSVMAPEAQQQHAAGHAFPRLACRCHCKEVLS